MDSIHKDDALIKALNAIHEATVAPLRLVYDRESIEAEHAELTTLTGADAVARLMDEHGIPTVAKWVELAALARGIRLELK